MYACPFLAFCVVLFKPYHTRPKNSISILYKENAETSAKRQRKTRAWNLQQSDQLHHFLHLGSPAGGNADDGVGVVVFFPEAKLRFALEVGELLVWQDDEDALFGILQNTSMSVWIIFFWAEILLRISFKMNCKPL